MCYGFISHPPRLFEKEWFRIDYVTLNYELIKNPEAV
jgi:hypothetical protein